MCPLSFTWNQTGCRFFDENNPFEMNCERIVFFRSLEIWLWPKIHYLIHSNLVIQSSPLVAFMRVHDFVLIKPKWNPHTKSLEQITNSRTYLKRLNCGFHTAIGVKTANFIAVYKVAEWHIGPQSVWKRFIHNVSKPSKWSAPLFCCSWPCSVCRPSTASSHHNCSWLQPTSSACICFRVSPSTSNKSNRFVSHTYTVRGKLKTHWSPEKKTKHNFQRFSLSCFSV